MDITPNLPEWATNIQNITESPINTASASLKMQINALQKNVISTKTRVLDLRSQISSLKAPSKSNKKAYAAYRAKRTKLETQLGMAEKKLASLREQRDTTKNKYWESTGQYERLLKGTERDAFMAVNALFKSYGLESLSSKIYDYVKNGYSPDTISILLQDSQEYKQRFSGNEARKQAGLPVLNPAEYLATEAAYRQIMESAGLPKGFYDNPADFSLWIGKNVSPSEIQNRVDLATQATVLANPTYRRALNQMGISDANLTAYFLDPAKALPYLQKSAATAAVGAEALAQGLTFDRAYAEQLALQGIGREEAQAGYSQVATELETFKALGQIYGEEWDQRTSEQAIFEGSAEAIKKKGRLLSQERGAFGGASGGARAGLSAGGGAR